MKILTGSQIREADQYTIEHEPIESLALMERASEVIAQWICNNIPQEQPLAFFIGKGNNGGDGLAVARMLHNVGYSCSVYVLFDKRQLSVECRYNLERLPHGVRVQGMDRVEVAEDAVAIDALLGTGVRGGLSEPVRGAIALVNGLGCRVISIDLPSGMLSEYGNAGREIVYADVTLTLEFPKLALLLSEAGEAAGEIVILPIELDENYKRQARSPYYYADGRYVSELVLPRSRFAHKGTYGHALLVCGSHGMMGAAVLATGAALRSGCGLVTAHVPAEERFVLHTSCPSALVSGDPMSVFSRLPDDMTKYAAVGIGSGVGKHDLSVRAFEALLSCGMPMVIDADALNMLAARPELAGSMPPGCVLTPHLGELRRLVGTWNDDQDRIEKVRTFAARYGCCMVVKGAHTMVCSPDGQLYFNATGNPGMAKGGSGDVLTGYIAGLLARGYEPLSAALLGVYVHGAAGDKAAAYYGQEGMNAADLIDFLGEALAEIQ